jgi:hypothetical protein
MNIYKNIDILPLYNYIKVTETLDLRYLIILPDYYTLPNIPEKELNPLIKVWENINDQVTEYIGISEDMKQMLRLEKSIALLRVELMVSGDKTLETIIQLKEMELNQMKPKTSQNIEDSIVLVELYTKLPINIFQTTVKRYYGYVKHISKIKSHDKS